MSYLTETEKKWKSGDNSLMLLLMPYFDVGFHAKYEYGMDCTLVLLQTCIISICTYELRLFLPFADLQSSNDKVVSA